MISWYGKPLTSRLRMAVRPLILVKLGMAVLLGLHGLTTLLYVGLSETQGQSSFFPFSGHLMGIPDFSAASLFFAHQVAWVYHVFTPVISPLFLVKSPLCLPSWTVAQWAQGRDRLRFIRGTRSGQGRSKSHGGGRDPYGSKSLGIPQELNGKNHVHTCSY